MSRQAGDGHRCSCPGCARCTYPCRTPRQSARCYTGYCKQCARSWRCNRCEQNSYPQSAESPFCSSCLVSRATWCPCTGCHHLGGSHRKQCPGTRRKERGGYCKPCSRRWQCPQCYCTLPGCPAGDLAAICPHCCVQVTPPPTSLCSCLGCSVHGQGPCTSAAVSGASAAYCTRCADAWQCECRLQSCRHHRLSSRCPQYIAWNDQRVLYQSRSKNICQKCSVQYCACTQNTCPSHRGRRCARRRHSQEGLCLRCAAGGGATCSCVGCAACGSEPCEAEAALLSTATADTDSAEASDNASCYPCALQAVWRLACQDGLQLLFVRTDENVLLADLHQSTSSLVDERRKRHIALWKCICGHILEHVASNATVAAPSANVPSCKYLLVRARCSQEWSLRDFHSFWYNHCGSKRRPRVSLSAELGAEDFVKVGETLSLPFAGAWMHCHGDVANFIATSADLPHFPANAPARTRPTYWKLVRTGNAADLIISSLDGLVSSLVCCLHGSAGVANLSCWLSTLHTCLKVSCDGDLGRALFLQDLASFFAASSPADWLARPASLARPLLLCDYQALGQHFGLEYGGVLCTTAAVF